MGFGIDASNCQRAWCRILDGVPLAELWDDPLVRAMCGGIQPPEIRPEQFVGTKAPRAGGSLILAAWAIVRALYCDLSYLYHGGSKIDIAKFGKSRDPSENPPILPVVSVHLHNARAIVGHVGRLLRKPHWSAALVGKPTANQVVIRHAESGVPIPVMALAGSRSASNLESYWCASVAFDEVFKLQGEKDAVINLDDARTAVRGRIVPGGQIAYVGSPWVAMGPAFELLEQYWMAPSRECVAVRATGPMLHPKLWTEEKLQRWAASKDQRDRDAADLGRGNFISKSSGLISDDEITTATRREADVPCRAGVVYVACTDPATRRNAWPFIIAHREGKKLIVDLAREWVPSMGQRLKPREVIRQMAGYLAAYGLAEVYSDQWSADALQDLAEERSVRFREHQLRGAAAQQALQAVVQGVANGYVELPPDANFRLDLQNIKRRVTHTGPSLYLAATPNGRHADYAATLQLATVVAPGEGKFNFGDNFPDGFMGNKLVKVVENPAEHLGVLEPVAMGGLGLY